MPEHASGLGQAFEHGGQLDSLSLESQLQGLKSASGLPTTFGEGGETLEDALDPSHRTLAFELANLEHSGHNDDLLAELDIDQPQQGRAAPFDKQELLDTSYDAESSYNGLPQGSAVHTPLRKAKSQASHMSLQQSPNGHGSLVHKQSRSFSNAIGIQEVQNEEDLVAALSATQSADQAKLDESMSAVAGFITQLEQSNDPASDMQTAVERIATVFVKDLYRAAQKRDEYLAELKEVQKALDNPDPTWQAALAEVEPMLPHEFGLPNESLLPIRKTRLATLVEEEQGQQQAGGKVGRISPADGKLFNQMVDLRSLTDGVIASLAAISEHSQIAKAANHDISRKLKALESGVARMKSEAESLERSIAHIAAFEAEEAKAMTGSIKQTALPGLAEPRRRKVSTNSSRSISSNGSLGASGRYSLQVKGEMKAAAKLLESAHEQAKVLLTVQA